jgi:cellulose synthase/poly-beta-1,6-N-acetylglucosamine synthase-like glycosyltransferase
MEYLSETLFYTLVFLAIYVQVFFLYTFLQKRSLFRIKDIEIDDCPEVTLLVPCWNEEDTVASTVDSLKSIDYPADKIKIILIDDGSSDSTWEVMQAFKNDAQITLLTKENGGKHTALNYALDYVDTELVCSFDADTVIVPDAVKRAVVRFREDPELMALGGAVLIESPKSIVQAAQSIEYQMFSFSKKVLAVLGGPLVVPGAFSMFRKQAFETVGGYKEAHLLEDLELTYRMQVAGLKVDHSHDAFVYTKGPKSLRALFKQRLRWSYGFINNTYDYRRAVFNPKYGNFGIFTLPMSILAYLIILQMFFVTWYHIIHFFIDTYVEISAVGLSSLVPASFDLFFIDTQVTTFLSLIMIGAIVMTIFLGKKISNIKGLSVKSLFWFFVVYTVMVPLWIIKALYNTIFVRKTAWR